MSEYLQNRHMRREKLKEMIKDLHNGATVDQVKQEFDDLLTQVGPTEIAQLEQALIKEGLPESEIQRLCDVHVEVFRESLDEQADQGYPPGHPLHTFQAENQKVKELIEGALRPLLTDIKQSSPEEIRGLLDRWRMKHKELQEIEKHYSRLENLLFPYLERYGLSGPPSVMWSIHDEIRAQLKEVSSFLEKAEAKPGQDEVVTFIDQRALSVLENITDMIYRENKVLFKFSEEALSEADWQAIKDESHEIGYTLVEPGNQWHAHSQLSQGKSAAPVPEGTFNFETGALTVAQMEKILNNLSVDITFVDQDNIVRYFSKPKDRVFTRTKAIIGRKVELCHPPESVHIVEKIVEEFQAGHKDTADFWLTINGSFVYIRYFALRDENGKYLGVMEVTQDVTEIRNLEGQKRLLDW